MKPSVSLKKIPVKSAVGHANQSPALKKHVKAARRDKPKAAMGHANQCPALKKHIQQQN